MGLNSNATFASMMLRGVILPPPPWFSLNNLEMIKAVILAFCSIQYDFIRDIHAESGISNSNYLSFADWGVSDFQISGQSFINGNCHNSTTSHDNNKKI